MLDIFRRGHLALDPARGPNGLKPEAWPLWLGGGPAEPAELKALLKPFPSEEMVCWPVSARVGNVRNNDPSLTEPIAAQRRYASGGPPPAVALCRGAIAELN